MSDLGILTTFASAVPSLDHRVGFGANDARLDLALVRRDDHGLIAGRDSARRLEHRANHLGSIVLGREPRQVGPDRRQPAAASRMATRTANAPGIEEQFLALLAIAVMNEGEVW